MESSAKTDLTESSKQLADFHCFGQDELRLLARLLT